MRRTVLSMLADAAERFPDRQYVGKKTDQGWKGKTFREIRNDTRALGCSLLHLGLPRGSTGAILAEGSPEWVTAELGIICAGCTSVPLSIRLLPEEIPFRLNHSGVKVIFISRNYLSRLLSVLHEVENADLLVVLTDGDRAHLSKTAGESGLVAGERLFLMEDLIAGGLRLEEELRVVDRIEREAAEDDVVTISYTSGTTGNPKGIMLTNRNYFVNCTDSVNVFQVPFDFETLLILPCDHSFAHTVGIYAALLRGITLNFVDARGGAIGMLRSIPVNILETNPVFILSVPALTGNFMKKITTGVQEKGGVVEKLFTAGMEAERLLSAEEAPRPSPFARLGRHLIRKIADLVVFRTIRRKVFGSRMKFFVGGGALLDRRQQEFFRALGVPVYQGYGLTEAAPVISSNTPTACRIGTSGRVLPSVECCIMAEDGSLLPDGEKGEIVVRGENVMKGYFRNEEATHEALRGGWLHTGDLGFFDEQGFLTVSGREKALLISSDGEKYSPEEIEETLINGSPLVHQVIVWNDHQKYTTALIVPDVDAVKAYIRKNPAAGPQEVLGLYRDLLGSFRTEKHLRNRFPAVWVPSTFQLLSEPFSDRNLLVNSTGKMVRYRVIETYLDLFDYMYTDEGSNCLNRKNLEVCGTLFFPAHVGSESPR